MVPGVATELALHEAQTLFEQKIDLLLAGLASTSGISQFICCTPCLVSGSRVRLSFLSIHRSGPWSLCPTYELARRSHMLVVAVSSYS